MLFTRSNKFKKNLNNLPEKIQRKTFERLNLFNVDQFESILNNHSLHGEYLGCRSINVSGDLRIIYKKISDTACLLVDIGTHSQLFG